MALKPLTYRRSRVGPGAWRVVRTYQCPQDESEGHEASLWDETPLGFTSGRQTPICQDVLRDDRVFGKRVSRITATWQTPTWEEWLLRNPNTLILSGKGHTTGEKVNEDLDGLTISGIDSSDTTGLTIWKIVSGQNIIARAKVVYVAYGIVDNRAMYIDQYTEHLGQVNASHMSKFGKHQSEGELLFSQLVFQPHPTENHRWRTWYHFLGREGGWNDDCEARQHDVEIHAVTVTGTERTRDVRVLVPTTTTRTARLFEDTTFAWINSAIQWG